MANSPDYYVTVCDHCLCASCWHGEFFCAEALGAGTKEVLASELLKLNLEHPSNYSRETLMKVCGSVKEAS